MMVEHLPVITIGRRAEAQRHLLASEAMLKLRGVEVVETDRGGDITFHGPGQLVVYPILNLNAFGLNLHSYMRLLEEAVIRVLAGFGIAGVRVEGATGVWVDVKTQNSKLKTQNGEGEMRNAECETRNGETRNSKLETRNSQAKICAMGVKLRRWVTLHGLALNVSTDLSFFQMINPCGLSKPVTSMREILGAGGPSMDKVKERVVEVFGEMLEEERRAAKRRPEGGG